MSYEYYTIIFVLRNTVNGRYIQNRFINLCNYLFKDVSDGTESSNVIGSSAEVSKELNKAGKK